MRKIGEWMSALQLELTIGIATFKDKGAGRFSRPFLLGIVAVYASYFALYASSTKKLAGLDKRIEAAKATAQYAEQYKGMRDRLRVIRAQLPLAKDRATYLTNAVVEAMRAEGVVADSIAPPQEAQLKDFYLQKISVTGRCDFRRAASLLHRLENAKPLVHVHSIDLQKAEGDPGANVMSVGLSTLVPGGG